MGWDGMRAWDLQWVSGKPLLFWGAHRCVVVLTVGTGHSRNPTPASCWLVTGTDELLSWMNRAGELR